MNRKFNKLVKKSSKNSNRKLNKILIKKKKSLGDKLIIKSNSIKDFAFEGGRNLSTENYSRLLDINNMIDNKLRLIGSDFYEVKMKIEYFNAIDLQQQSLAEMEDFFFRIKLVNFAIIDIVNVTLHGVSEVIELNVTLAIQGLTSKDLAGEIKEIAFVKFDPFLRLCEVNSSESLIKKNYVIDYKNRIYFSAEVINTKALKWVFKEYFDDGSNYKYSVALCKHRLLRKESILFAAEINIIKIFFEKNDLFVVGNKIYGHIDNQIMFLENLKSYISHHINEIIIFFEKNYNIHFFGTDLDFKLKENKFLIIDSLFRMEILNYRSILLNELLILFDNGYYDLSEAKFYFSENRNSVNKLKENFDQAFFDRNFSLVVRLNEKIKEQLAQVCSSERKKKEGFIEVKLPSEIDWDLIVLKKNHAGVILKKVSKKPERNLNIYGNDSLLDDCIDKLNIIILRKFLPGLTEDDILRSIILLVENKKKKTYEVIY